jgi:hypothetical protein
MELFKLQSILNRYFSMVFKYKVVFIALSVFSFVAFFIYANSHSKSDFMKGMTISCQTWGKEWATPEMKNTLIELKSLGVNWFSIHPYARIWNDGTIRFRGADNQDHITTPLEWAKELDMKVMLKPHLAYWGSEFSWRGDIDFSSEQEWSRFFNDYENWIVTIAEIAQKKSADILCIGTEYQHSIRHEQKWGDIIKAVRKVYSGKLTYGANWDTYMKIKFWDVLDYVGIQAYFPLLKDGIPTDQRLREGWEKIFENLRAFSREANKKIIFTEIGYSTAKNAAEQPWLPDDPDVPEAREIQKRCLRVALDRSAAQEYIAGIFLWKWFPETQPFRHYEDYDLQRPEIKQLIKEQWGS